MGSQQKSKIVDIDITEIISDISEFSEKFEGSKILLVGGRGFIGTYFLKTLIRLNDILQTPLHVTVMDNLITAKNTDEFNSPNVTFVEYDISDKISLKNNFDYIIHSASIASPPIYRKYPLKTVDVNYQGTRNILEFANKTNVKSILFLSSSEIYGDPDVFPTPEDYWGYVSSTGPRACYDESKRLAETISTIFFQEFKTPIKIVRPFNVYGPFLNLNDGRVIPDFMNSALKKSEILIHSDGTPTRSFCYVSDAMRAFFRVLVLAPSGSIFNVGNGEEISMYDLAKKIQKIIPSNINIKLEKNSDPDYLKDNPQRRCPDLSKIKKDLNYIPKISIETGLKRIYEWYQNEIK
jgi:UDP-glucuronate decarboxylase